MLINRYRGMQQLKAESWGIAPTRLVLNAQKNHTQRKERNEMKYEEKKAGAVDFSRARLFV